MSAFPATRCHPTGDCTDRGLVASFVERFGVEVLSDSDIVFAREVGAKMIGPNLADSATLIECQRIAGAVVFGYRESDDLTGMMALLPLGAAALSQLENATFDACDLDLDLIARPGEKPACYYAWGIAATSKNAARALIQASAALHTQLFWSIPSFTRAATDDGLRVMSSFGYRPFADADPRLLKAAAPGAPKAISA